MNRPHGTHPRLLTNTERNEYPTRVIASTPESPDANDFDSLAAPRAAASLSRSRRALRISDATLTASTACLTSCTRTTSAPRGCATATAFAADVATSRALGGAAAAPASPLASPLAINAPKKPFLLAPYSIGACVTPPPPPRVTPSRTAPKSAVSSAHPLAVFANPIPGSSHSRHGSIPAFAAFLAAAASSIPTTPHVSPSAYVTFEVDCMSEGSPRMCIAT